MPATRAAVLIDAAAYFSAFAAAVQRAERSILILSWDIDSRVNLRLDGTSGTPASLGAFLDAVVSRRPELHTNVLNWDFAMIYALEREALPVFKLGWRTHRRLHFRLDDAHPLGGSQHQKIVVVDDRVAFAGGLDLCDCRWDTNEHCPHDPARVDAAGNPYGPFHDVQMIVEGAAAAALGDLARERWRRATGKRLEPPRTSSDPWPPGLVPDFTDVTVAIARTDPELNGRAEVREVERLYLDAIAAARHTIYIENQYFTSAIVGDALAERLAEADGPEIIVVGPCVCSGWLEENTMGVLRGRLLRRLRHADRYARLRAFYPVAQPGDARINVHSKVLVIDDVMLRVGSANTSNRSMGLDAECDLAIEAEGDQARARTIAAIRNRLLAEHLGTTPDAVADAIAAGAGSLIAAIDAVLPSSSTRTLVPMPDEQPVWAERLVPAVALADPERPLDTERLIDGLLPDEVRESGGRRFLQSGGLLLVVLALAALWRWTEFAHWIHPRTVIDVVHALHHDPFAPLVVAGIYVAGGLVLVPVLLLVVATTLAFGFQAGIAYALVGALSSATITWAIGAVLGRNVVRRLAGPRLNRVSRRLAGGGTLAMTRARLLPLAPFTIVNLIAGAAHVRLATYVVGTACGMLPGIVVSALFADRLRHAVREPGIGSFAMLAVIVAVVLMIGWWLRRYYVRVDTSATTRSIARGDVGFGAATRATAQRERA